MMRKTYKLATDLTERQRRTYAERLLRLCVLLQNLPNKQYRHDIWVASLGKEESKGKTCGTVACALGHAAANPAIFPGLNLRVLESEHEPGEFDLVAKEGEPDVWDDENASDSYFGLDAYHEIFTGGGFNTERIENITKSMVTKLITRFVAERYGYEPA